MTSIIENYPIMKKHNRVQNQVIIGEHQKSMSVIIGDLKYFMHFIIVYPSFP